MSYFVQTAGNGDGDGLVGESFLEAFSAQGGSLGIVAVNGTGTKNVSGLFGGVPLSRFLLTAAADSLRIESLQFAFAEPVVQELDFSTMGTLQLAAFDQCGVAITGSANLNLLDFNGLGVVGGLSDNTIGGGESISVSFAGAARDVSYFVWFAGNGDGDGLVGESFLEAFSAQGGSLGIVAVNDTGTKDVSGLFGDVALSGFEVTSMADSIRIGWLRFVPEPEAASPAALVSIAMLWLRRRRRSARTGSTC